jgi:voltage-gated potassium channel
MKAVRGASRAASTRTRTGKPVKTVGEALAQAHAQAAPREHPRPARREDGLRLRARLRALYHGSSTDAVTFRLTVLWIDFLIIVLFIAAPLLRHQGWAYYAIDYAIATVLAFDLLARGYAHGDWRNWLKRPIVWVDLFVLATLLFPVWLYNLGFLRILRLWTLINSDFFWRTVGRRYDDTRVEEVTKAAVALVTFLFIATGFVYAAFDGSHPGMNGYLDALYFTVTTLTTTGFGDVTLPGAWGRMLSIIIMLVGVTLFVRLAQALFKGGKVFFACIRCGLRRHDLDAVHCKACGKVLCIPDDGI